MFVACETGRRTDDAPIDIAFIVEDGTAARSSADEVNIADARRFSLLPLAVECRIE